MDRVVELIDEYTEARKQRKRRAIENKILAESVWQDRQNGGESFVTFSKEEGKQILEGV